MKQNAPLKEIVQVENEMIPFHLKSIAEILGISTEDLKASNEELRNQVLKLYKKMSLINY